MNKQKINPILLKIIAWCGLLLLGVAVGGLGMNQYIRHQYRVMNKAEDTNTGLLTDKIAVVNLDEGTVVQDEEVNYADRLLINLKDNFLLTGLEDARRGYATGIYAGYVIIPANFSGSVVSLNDTPVRAEISYAINNELQKDVKEQVIYDVLDMVNNLDDNVSYMYMHSVLDDLHTAQDEADKIMSNDIKEKEAIDAVQAYDLVALVPVVELTEIENTIEPVDISDYMTKNAEFAGEVGLKYTEYLMESEEEHQKINEEAIGLMDEMSNMSGLISDISLVQNGDEGLVYQSGEEELDSIFEEYNAAVTEAVEEQEENIIKIYQDINLYLDEYDRALEAHQSQNSTLYHSTLDELEVLFDNYKQKGYTIVSEKEIQSMKAQIQAQNITIANQQNLIEELEEREQEGNLDRVEKAESNKKGMPKTDENSIEETETKKEESDKSKSEEVEADESHSDEIESDKTESGESDSEKAELQEGKLDESSISEETHMALYIDDGANTPESGSGGGREDDEGDKLTELQEDIVKILEGNNYYVFGGTLLDEEGIPMQDEDGEYIPLTSILEPYEKELYLDTGEPDIRVREEILEEQMVEFEPMDMQKVMTCINENIVTPIQENVEDVTTAILDQYAVEQDQLMAYNDAIMEYNPLDYINQDEMQLLTDEMMDNGSALSEAVLETDIQQMEYVTGVYAATREDLFALQENIAATKEESDKAVEEGLQDLKDTKNANSIMNQEILDDFSNTLPYTRLGSLEYVQAYEFMVNPVGSIDVEQGENRQKTQQDSVRSANDNINVVERREADFQNISILICVMICVIIVAATIKHHFHKKEESYELE